MEFTTLGLNTDGLRDGADDENVESTGFWKRQFRQEPTRKQNIFDWLYGVILPLVCVAGDPIVFRGLGWDGGLLATYRPFAYLLSAVSILGMAAWLLWGSRSRWLAAPLAGLFFVGGGVSLIVGIVLFPLSLFGLLFLIGILGFTPLFSSIVFFRNGVRAYRSSRLALGDQAAWQAALLAAVFSFVTPYVINIEIYYLVNKVATGDVNTIRRESAKLVYVGPLVDPTPISHSYFESSWEEKESPRMKALAEAYEDLSGTKIE